VWRELGLVAPVTCVGQGCAVVVATWGRAVAVGNKDSHCHFRLGTGIIYSSFFVAVCEEMAFFTGETWEQILNEVGKRSEGEMIRST
jgi:hypothetical protein